jgi:hypothetical protein
MARVGDIVFDCEHPASLARFWAAALDDYAVAPYGPDEDPETDPHVLVEGPGPRLWCQLVPEGKTAKNRCHLDLVADDLEAEVRRLESLGATRLAHQPEADSHLVALADPAGNEFCVYQREG